MTEYTTIRFELDGPIARLTLNRAELLNAINDAMHDELADALDRLGTTPARVLVLTGAGRGFCAGQDLSDRAPPPDGQVRDLSESIERRYNPLVRRLLALDIPTLCAVNGVAAGAGANLAMAADLCVAVESARFVQAFTRIGLIPDCGGTWQLAQRVGQARALGLALLAEPIDARTAADWGLIWCAVPETAFAATVDTLATQLASGATRALVAARHSIRGAANRSLDEQLDHERDAQRTLGFSQDYAEGVAAFAAKRAPAFRNA